jgi:hypothetical protein
LLLFFFLSFRGEAEEPAFCQVCHRTGCPTLDREAGRVVVSRVKTRESFAFVFLSVIPEGDLLLLLLLGTRGRHLNAAASDRVGDSAELQEGAGGEDEFVPMLLGSIGDGKK